MIERFGAWLEENPLRRFLAIVLTSILGAIGCWLWVLLLLELPHLPSASGRSSEGVALGLGIVVIAVQAGGTCGLFLALPAIACLWNRRLVPALLFVLAVGYGVATMFCVASFGGAAASELPAALPATLIAVFLALLCVRFFPGRWWRRPDASGAVGKSVAFGVTPSETPARTDGAPTRPWESSRARRGGTIAGRSTRR